MLDHTGSLLLAAQFQLDQSQWWPADTLHEFQFRQLRSLLQHACETVPYYRQRASAYQLDARDPLSAETWARLPVLRRSTVQACTDQLVSATVPPDHGRVSEQNTTGSTGQPLRFQNTDLARMFAQALGLRDHLWHQRDLGGKLAVIRFDVEVESFEDWGAPAGIAFETGQMVTRSSSSSDAELARWLEAENPTYLLANASTLHALAKYCLAHQIRLPGLREVRSRGELVPADLPEHCRAAWNVPVTDLYSAEETATIALQCPEHRRYHVQSENVFVEVLDEDDQPVRPGGFGRVVVTPLHNFATPLIRYDLRDYAEVGAACPCGRGLPVLARIVGRQRNLMVLPDGSRHRPSFPASVWLQFEPVRQVQLVQRSRERIEVRLVADRCLRPDETLHLVEALREQLGYPFEITIDYRERIERGAGGKLEDFICELE